MGVLLREVLKTICVNNQWSYAVFWKIGCQNANLLIWEECYNEPSPSSLPSRICGINPSQLDNAAPEKVHLLINRMMLNNRIILVGEGIVGRTAFTGNHQWMLANNFNRDIHPPEVANEMLLQFSAGMQTLAVIPVLPHGVVQLGSHLAIMENSGFVNDVKRLILQLGYVPGALLSENYGGQESADLIGVPVSVIMSSQIPKPVKQFGSVTNTCKQNIGSSKSSNLADQVLTNSIEDQMRRLNSGKPFGEPQSDGFLAAEVIPSNQDAWPSSFNSRSGLLYPPVICGQSSCNRTSLGLTEQQIMSYPGFQENGTNINPTNVSSASQERKEGSSFGGAAICEDMHNLASCGNDLFDILGVDLKNRGLSESWSNSIVGGPDARTENLSKEFTTRMNFHDVKPDIYTASEGIQVFTDSGTDNLLDAVVSGACSSSKNISDDTESCRTTLTKISNSSGPSHVNTSNELRGGLCELTKVASSGTIGSSCFRSGYGKDDAGTCSGTASAYGSQVSSWVEQAQNNVKRESSVSTGYSKVKNETPKPNRKRLKPGENPRPRPKDRQMIQDRVKELREIIPNTAKCSIDALLERTIKHMLFLQSVTKHADKLKHAGDSKIINKEGGLLLKENFEGGATWAFEVGTQSMVCPIVVEDLNPPRNFLIEMLCEERGFFLEIADWIRGLGLTILKGVMEARNDKIWAHFAVEANQDVTRMEIFMSLVQLLEQNMKSIGPSVNILDRINGTAAMHSFPQAASIPVTGGCSM